MKKEKHKLMLQASYASIGVTILLLILKFLAFMSTNSVAVLSTLFDSIQDLMTSGINFIAVHHSITPADKDHRFGHGKAQAIGGLFQAIIIFISAIVLIFQSCQHLQNHQVPNIFSFGTIFLLFSIILTAALLKFQKYVIKMTNSISIRADMSHYTGDIWMNTGVIISLICSTLLNIYWIDILFGVGVGLYLCKVTLEIIKDAFAILMDKELPEHVQNKIKQITLSVESVNEIKDLKTRQSGSCLFIQMTVLMDPKLTLKKAHQQSDLIENKLHKVFHDSEIILHLEPDSK